MVVLLALVTTAYFAVVLWVRRSAGAAGADPVAVAVELPEEDRPPESAVGWPPSGAGFESYVDEGFAALDAYLSEGFAA